MDETAFLLIGAVIVGGGAFLLYFAFAKHNESAIRQEISRLGGQDITISRQLLDFDKNTNTYIVTFLDPSGRRVQTTCKVRSTGGELYWTKTPAELIGFPNGQERLNLRGAKYTLNKEELINGLTSGYQYERKAAAKQVVHLPEVSEQVVLLLQEMAATDPEPFVREAATESLQNLGRV